VAKIAEKGVLGRARYRRQTGGRDLDYVNRLFKYEVTVDIYCADIGSLQKGTFGWYGQQSDGIEVSGQEMRDLAESVAQRLNAGLRVSLGFEAPMFVPLRTDPRALTRKRIGETDKNWIGGPGGPVLATALVQVPWILAQIREKLISDARATVNWDYFCDRKARLFLWEAFVSGGAKGTSHVEDARIAVEKFADCLPNPMMCNVIHEDSVFSILGASLLRTGWTSDLKVLETSPLVLRPGPTNHGSNVSKNSGPSQRRASTGSKKCPECGRPFKGTGWGGIDAHWKAAHNEIMSYETAWPLIKSGKKPSDTQ